jgi:hypothetical protein
MENKPTNVEELFQKIRDYADVRLQLLKLKSINKVSGFLSFIITTLILIIFICAVFICITIGAALLIGDCVGRTSYGFLIVGGIYLIIGLVFYSLRGKIIRTKIKNKLIKELID